MKMNPLHKKLFLLVIVFGPFFWLVFTEDGQRRTDLVIATLFQDGDPMNVSFAKLKQGATLEDFKGNFPDLRLECGPRPSPFGDHLCRSPIRSVNGTPAKLVTLYFDGAGFSALEILYSPHHHTYLHGMLLAELGESTRDVHDGADTAVLRWTTPHGAVLLPESAQDENDSLVYWISASKLR
ncbi:MAG: hypothetical protein ACPGU7_01460 [Gammaproteobacteria bacterium]